MFYNSIMKKSVLGLIASVIFLFPSYTVSAQPSIYKAWVGEQLQYLEITSKTVNFDYGYRLDDFGFLYNDSVLTLIDYFYTQGKIRKQHEDYVYKIIKLTDDTLVLSPLNAEAARLINNQQRITFIDRSLIYDSLFQFQKIYFSGTGCYGNCPAMKLEIDSSGKIIFLGEYNTGVYKGLHEGYLNRQQLDSLIDLLSRSDLDRFPTILGHAIDAPTYQFKFHYNGKERTSKGYFVPCLDLPMLYYLLSIYKRVSLKKIDGAHTFAK